MDSTEADLINAIRGCDVVTVQRLVREDASISSAPLAGAAGRTPLHIATDWPGYFPYAPEVVPR